jgi:hypothetical protein
MHGGIGVWFCEMEVWRTVRTPEERLPLLQKYLTRAIPRTLARTRILGMLQDESVRIVYRQMVMGMKTCGWRETFLRSEFEVTHPLPPLRRSSPNQSCLSQQSLVLPRSPSVHNGEKPYEEGVYYMQFALKSKSKKLSLSCSTCFRASQPASSSFLLASG